MIKVDIQSLDYSSYTHMYYAHVYGGFPKNQYSSIFTYILGSPYLGKLPHIFFRSDSLSI